MTVLARSRRVRTVVSSGFLLVQLVLAQKSDSADVKLRLKIIEQEFCGEADALTSVRLNVQLIFSNPMAGPVIVSRLGKVLRVQVKREETDIWQASREITETEIDPPSVWSSSQPNLQLFDVIPPKGELQSATRTVLIPVSGHATNGKGSLPSGTYGLTIDIGFGLPPDLDSKSLGQKWQRFGKLRTERVRSELTQLTVPENLNIRVCKGPPWLKVEGKERPN